jgi:transcriptional antiterminator NusG
MTTDPATTPEVAEPALPEAAPEPTIVIDSNPESTAALVAETPPEQPPAAPPEPPLATLRDEPEHSLPEPLPASAEMPVESQETLPEEPTEPPAELPEETVVEPEAALPEETAAEPQADAAVEPPAEPAKPLATVAEPAAVKTPEKPVEKPRNPNLRWYVVKVQSGREDSIKEAIERRVKIEGVEDFFGQVVVPTEREVVVIQSGKRKGQKQIKKKKKFPGYVMAEVEYNDKILYLFRETSGVGDFVGGSLTRAPQPMSDREVQSMLRDSDEPLTKEEGAKKAKESKVIAAPKKLPYGVGDRVRVRDGTFQNMEGEVKEIREPKDPKDNYQISVELTVWGRPVKVQLDYWQIDPV